MRLKESKGLYVGLEEAKERGEIMQLYFYFQKLKQIDFLKEQGKYLLKHAT